MVIYFSESRHLTDFQDQLGRLMAHEGVTSVMVFAADGNAWEVESVTMGLRKSAKPVFGGLFPRILHGGASFERGFVLVGLPLSVQIEVLEGLSEADSDFEGKVLPIAERWSEPEGAKTLLVIADALSTRIAALVNALFYGFGLEANFIGGGAGSLSFEQKPCLICGQGLIADAALLVRLPLQSGVGVAHGWEPISDVMKVTESEGPRIHTLDWEPAFERYRQIVEPHAGRAFSEGAFFDLAKEYPFGMSKLGAELVVRDPLMATESQDLICVGEVPRGSFVRLLNGTPESLIAAAGRSLNEARLAYPEDAPPPAMALFIDCISRALFLGDRLGEELREANREALPLVGAMTLGEIANSGRDYLEFYNKTAVMCLLGPGHEQGG